MTPGFKHARIKFKHSGAKTASSILPTSDPELFFAIAHLTQGYKYRLNDFDKAFDVTGTCEVHGVSAADLRKWSFRFIQFSRSNTISATYAGRVDSEGSIEATVNSPPLMPNAFYLDSLAGHVPFTSAKPHKMTGNMVSVDLGDHPHVTWPNRLNNRTTNVENFLFQILYDVEFWSVFTAISPSGERTYLCHAYWQVNHDYLFNWVGSKLQRARSRKGSFRVISESKDGPPSVTGLKGLLDDPKPPLMNDDMQKSAVAITTASRDQRVGGLLERDTWPSALKLAGPSADFWR